jgi:hypothetical protein
MNAKLTLKLENEAIGLAKEYAELHHLSLSKLVEEFFKSLRTPSKPKKKTPLAEALSGILSKSKLPTEKDRFDHLLRKHA